MGPMERVAREFGLLVRSLKGLHAVTAAQAGVRLEMPALAVLTTLDERGRLRASALAEALHLDLSSVSRQVTALEREGLVVRERDPADSRAALLEMSPAGHEALAAVRAARVAQLRRMLPDWTDDELSDFADSLHRFRADLTRAQTDRTPTEGPPADRAPVGAPTTAALPHHDQTPALAGQERS